jgi:hypothetical protein
MVVINWAIKYNKLRLLANSSFEVLVLTAFYTSNEKGERNDSNH